jgi:hypothetical protein
MYDESTDYETKASTLSDQLAQQGMDLNKQVQARVDQAKHDLDAIR